MGLNYPNTYPDTIGCINQTLLLAKLLYGTENCSLTTNDINCTKQNCQSYNLANSTMNTSLLAAFEIQSIKKAI